MSESSVLGSVRPARRAIRPRGAVVAAVLAALWTAAYAVVYVLVARSQPDSAVAWWYVAVLAGAGVGLLAAAVTGARILLASTAAVLLGGCALLGVLSVGLLLVPGVVLAVLAAALPGTTRRRPPADT